MSEFTPWNVLDAHGTVAVRADEDPWDLVCVVHGKDRLKRAHLIAAAPELLYELQETHAALCLDPEYLGSKRYHRNKAAIKKAGGEL